jgi:hypothetical protein
MQRSCADVNPPINESAELTQRGPPTVTRPYAVRGGENDCFIWSGYFLAQVPEFSSIFRNPGIFLRFTWSSVRRVLFLCWYFTFLGAGRHFRNFPEITLWKNERVHMMGSNAGSQEYNSTPLPLHHNYLTWKYSKYNIFFFIYSTSCTHNKRMSEFAIKNKQ